MTTTASAPSTDKVHQIQAATSPEGDVRFALPFNPQLIDSVEAVDLDLMLTTTSGEKYILQQGALLATTNTESKLVFSNGDAMSAADQMKRMGVMKPVEGGSFRLASALTPEAADKVTGNEFGLGKDAQDTVAKIEKIIQSLESATQSSQSSESNSAQGLGKNSAFKSNADPLASPAPGTPPKPDETQNVSPVKVNDTPRSFTGSSDKSFDGLLITAAGSSNYDPAKPLKQVDLTQINIDKPIQVDLHSQSVVDLSKNQGTLTLPGALNATKLELTLASGTSPDGFAINGQSFVNGKIVISDVKSLTDLKLLVDWDAKSEKSQTTTFEIGVVFFNGTTKLDYGNAPLNFEYGDTLPKSTLDGNGNLKIFLSESGYSYNVKGTDNIDKITTGSGNDTLNGGLGADTMIGGKGDDTYVVDNANDVVTELTGEGNDTIEASVSYTLSTNVENLTLTGSDNINATGNTLNNTLTGNSGNNILIGGAGNDIINGGDGIDTASYAGSAAVNVSLVTNAVNTGGDAQGDFLTNIENLIGSSNNDTLTGNSSDNTLEGGAGADTIDGGDGVDTVSYASSTAAVTVSLATGATNTGGDAQGDTLSNIEKVIGSRYNDTLTGDMGVNRIEGGAGNDTLDGGGGADTLLGGANDDTYKINNAGVTIIENPSEGDDTVISSINYTLGNNLENLTLTGDATRGTGNGDNNVITGNGNNNVLSGGAGNDTLVINTSGLSTGTFDGGTGTDTLKISAASGATIDLTGIDNSKFSSIEKIDFSNDGASSAIKISSAAIRGIVDNEVNSDLTILIKDGQDTVQLIFSNEVATKSTAGSIDTYQFLSTSSAIATQTALLHVQHIA